ncbi:MAG: C2 family cysteine protease [Bryobacteraceae bacterium]
MPPPTTPSQTPSQTPGCPPPFDEPDRRIGDGGPDTELSDPGIPVFPSTDSPKYDEIMQGQIGNCPLMAILGGIANAKPTFLRDMVQELPGCKVRTRYGKKNYVSNAITVKFTDRTIFVSKMLWRDEGGDLLYAHGANSKASWMSYVEKAYAQRGLGGYPDLDGQSISGKKPTANAYFEKVLGSPEQLMISGAKDQEIWDFISDPKTYAILGGSKKTGVGDKYVPDHGYTVIAADKKHDAITLYNPWGCDNGFCGSKAPLTNLATFRNVFEFLLRAKV